MKKDCQNIEALFLNYINKSATKKLNNYIENHLLTSTSVSDTQPLYKSKIKNYGNLEDALEKGTGNY